MGEALITRRGGIDLSNVTIKRLPAYTEENLYKGMYIVPITLYDSEDNVDGEGIAVFADGVLIYNEFDDYGYLSISGGSSGMMRFSNHSNYSNYSYGGGGVSYKVEN